MARALSVAALALLLAGCHAGCCGKSRARADAPATETPATETPVADNLGAIPLGAPPGGPIAAADAIKNPYEGNAEAVSQGKVLFTAMNCVYCHGSNAAGMIGPSLEGPGWRYGGAPVQIYNSIHDGRPKGMPSWGKLLPPDQIWQLTAYIESLGGAQPPATPAMRQIGALPSTTGPEVNGQDQTDTAHAALIDAQARSGPTAAAH